MSIKSVEQRYLPASPEIGVGPCPPDNSEFRRIGEDVLAAAKYVFCVAATHPGCQPKSDSIEAAFIEALRSMKEDRRQQYQATARRLLAADEGIRSLVLGRYAAFPPEQVSEKGFDDLITAAGPLKVDRKLLGLPAGRERGALDFARLESVWGPITAAPSTPMVPEGAGMPHLRSISGPADPEVPFPGYYRKCEFMVKWIHCIDETNPEWPGSDEIAIGGVAVHTSGGVTKIGSKTYEDFDDNNKEWFSPHWTFASFEKPKPKSGEWLYDTYGVMVALAEVDAGGFGKFLDKIYGKVQEKVMAAIAVAVAAGATPFVGPYVGAIAGAVAAWVVDKLIEWFISWFGDDPFPVKFATLTGPRGFAFYLPDVWVYEGAGYRSEDYDLHFYGHGGHYAVRYYWRVREWVNGSGPQ